MYTRPNTWPSFTDAAIRAHRPAKQHVDPNRPYAYLVEPEATANGNVEEVATLFLTNRECPFTCLMCDLWQHTTDTPVPVGSIPRQIDYALDRLPEAQHIKLYNSGNFFDRKAIPREDWPAIAERVRGFKSVIVENHPKLCNEDCLRFQDLLGVPLEIALGLETIHPGVLPRLNKGMTLDDFETATTFLHQHGISTRAFILLRPPFLSEQEGVEWALKSVAFARERGVSFCAVIPTRFGNGMLNQLAGAGHFNPPSLASLEGVLQEALRTRGSRVTVDLWDVEQFFDCEACGPARKERLQAMNLQQSILPLISCTQCDAV